MGCPCFCCSRDVLKIQASSLMFKSTLHRGDFSHSWHCLCSSSSPALTLFCSQHLLWRPSPSSSARTPVPTTSPFAGLASSALRARPDQALSQFQCETGNGCGMNGVPTKAQVTANEVKASSKHLGSFPRISHDPVKFSRVAGHLWLRRQKNGSTWLHSSEAWQKGSLDPQSGRSGESVAT